MSSPKSPTTDDVLTDLDTLKVCAALDALDAKEDEEGRRESTADIIARTADLPLKQTEKILESLEEVGYVIRFREYGHKPGSYTMWASLSEAGVEALESHLAFLKNVVEG